MNRTLTLKRPLLPAVALTAFSWSSLFAQSTTPPPNPSDNPPPPGSSSAAASASNDEPVVLSPFVVDTSKDKGYRATNSISGTRLNTAIKDLPMPLEVITPEFIRDTGAYNLRQSLSYSAGVTIQSQNDWSTANAYANPGGVNNPNGQTANKTDSTIKIRGFLTDVSLRDGFRRQVTTDSVNVSRVEVVRGPAALLYGIGNFGGVVNYLVKQPEDRLRESASLTVGTHEFVRGEVDFTGPVTDVPGLGFRLSAAVQRNGDYTEYFENKKAFVAPIFTYKPFEKTVLTFDFEYGQNRQDGIGFQSLRARADIDADEATGSQARFERAGFVVHPGQNLRTMRWSGPDTSLSTRAGNLQIKGTQELLPKLNLLAAYNHSSVTFKRRDVNGNVVSGGSGPVALRTSFRPVILDAARGDNEGFQSRDVPDAIVQYGWQDQIEGTRSDQSRVELTYSLNVFSGRKWAAFKNDFLAGVSTEYDKSTEQIFGIPMLSGVFNYKSPADPSPFRFATQGDGTPSVPLRALSWNRNHATNTGLYAVYQGQFFNKMLTLVGGVRQDRNSVKFRTSSFDYDTGGLEDTFGASTPRQKHNTKQLGVSISPIRQLSFYAMTSEGLMPNFDGEVDLTGVPLDATKAKNREIGLKFDVWGGRISGTISKYKITRSNVPMHPWWVPQTLYKNFDPSRPTVYEVSSFNPETPEGVNNNYAWFGDLRTRTTDPYNPAEPVNPGYRNDGLNDQRANILTAWNAAKSSGAVTYFTRNASGAVISTSEAGYQAAMSGGSDAWMMLNASSTQGAAYMDAVINYTRQNGLAHPGTDNWPGWLYATAPEETGFNTATMDAVFSAPPGLTFAALGGDIYEGYDAQVVITPIDELQILLSYSHNEHTITSLGQLPRHPNYAQDRWPIWLFPNGTFGLNGVYGPNDQYANEADSSTFQFKNMLIPGLRGDDTPEDEWSIWVNYKFDRVPRLKGLTAGAGAQHKSKREYASGFDHSSGEIIRDNMGNPVILYTPPQWNVDAMARYEFKWEGRPMFAQVNVHNLLDDKKRYGFLYGPGRRINFTFGVEF